VTPISSRGKRWNSGVEKARRGTCLLTVGADVNTDTLTRCQSAEENTTGGETLVGGEKNGILPRRTVQREPFESHERSVRKARNGKDATLH